MAVDGIYPFANAQIIEELALVAAPGCKQGASAMGYTGTWKERAKAKVVSKRIRPPRGSSDVRTAIPALGPAEPFPSNVNISFEGEGGIVLASGSNHPLAGAKLRGGVGGGRFKIGDVSAERELEFDPIPQSGSVYLYLAKEEWAKTWIEGGSVPLFPAAKYRSEDRKGVMTPDEIRQFSANVNDQITYKMVQDHYLGMSGIKGGTFENLELHLADGQKLLLNGRASDYEEDAYLFCAASELSLDLMRKLDKTVCVEIADLSALKASFDKQIGQVSFAGRVGYTAGIERGHFLKSDEDSWQAEYRMAWIKAGSEPLIVNVPAGTAKLADPK